MTDAFHSLSEKFVDECLGERGELIAIRSVVMCDFDDTMVTPDTGVVILDRFADGDWRALDRLYNTNEMPLEEIMRHQFAMVKNTTKNSMIQEVERSVSFRPGFEELVQTCNQSGVPVLVVSYGLDFCINHLLTKAGLTRKVEVYAPKATLGPNGIGFTYPQLRLKDSVNLKHDLVRHHKQQGDDVTFVGDGTSDFAALKTADMRFAIKGSVLAGLCERDKIQHSQITSFDPVTRTLRARSLRQCADPLEP